MTTTILVHNNHRAVHVKTEDRVWDPIENKLTDRWVESGCTTVAPGQLFQTYCTDTRRVVISEPLAGS